MSDSDVRDRLYELMPVLYREQDEQQGFPLRELLRIVTEQADIVHTDITRLWDDFFIETCDRWAIPYVGDLVSNRLLHDAQDLVSPDSALELFDNFVGPDLRAANAIRTRADVAKTIYYRRRKGTLPMLEELARDVTGWAAHAVEFFELLTWCQNLNHLRLHSTGCPDRAAPRPWDASTAPSTSPATPWMCARPRSARAGTTSATSVSSCGACVNTRPSEWWRASAVSLQPAGQSRATVLALAPRR
jgi:hypothetical protein